MRVKLREIARTEALVTLQAALPPASATQELHYRTRVGAIASIDGRTAGAFDREHSSIVVPASSAERVLELSVERHGLPTNGLPPGDDIRWRWMVARSHPEPRAYVDVRDAADGAVERQKSSGGAIPLWGHSHLDVAWLWTYEQTKRKAVRTFANALALLERDPSFIFIQSQPQLYAFVAEEDPELFARVRDAVRGERFDAGVAAMWVEPDCNLPSGESLLRQMLYAHHFCMAEFGIEPKLAWLPDSFGFTRTLPTLLAHAAIPYFGTTKLQWNETTRFPYPQFRWRGPDGSEVLGALIASYDGGPDARRAAIARERREPMVVGYGDGGGGPTEAHLREAAKIGEWQHPYHFFEALDRRRESLPVHEDELYLEYHRGVYTTHHDVKAANAALERALSAAEEHVAWCAAVHAPRETIARLREGLDAVWRVVLRNQFHDVLPGTSIRSVYEDVVSEYEDASELTRGIATAARGILPRAPRHERGLERSEPVRDGDEWLFDNGLLRARVTRSGTITELSATGAPNVAAQVNLLAAYRDRPRKWEAWNVDAGYERHRVRIDMLEANQIEGGLEIGVKVGESPGTLRLALHAGEPFLRVDLALDWHERETLLRVENWLTIDSSIVTYGAAHGTIERSARNETPEERAKFEVPGQRFAAAADAARGLAVFALDTYGWSARALPKGGLHLGHSLLRGTSWPDPQADRGVMHLSWAFVPFSGATTGALERAWEQFAHERRVRLFTTSDDSLLVVACKPAADGDGVIVRVRECDGQARPVRLRAGGRMREAHAVDALERPIVDDVKIENEELLATIPGFGLRSFRVRF